MAAGQTRFARVAWCPWPVLQLRMPLREPLRRLRTSARAGHVASQDLFASRTNPARRPGARTSPGVRIARNGDAAMARWSGASVVPVGRRQSGIRPVSRSRSQPPAGKHRILGASAWSVACPARRAAAPVGRPALRHGPSTSGARGGCTWRRPRPHRPSAAMPAGGTGRRPDMRSPARPPARILRSWPTTRHRQPHARGSAPLGSHRDHHPTAAASPAGSGRQPASRRAFNAALRGHGFGPASPRSSRRSLRHRLRQLVRIALHLARNTVASRKSAHRRPSLEGPAGPWAMWHPNFLGYASPNVIPGSVSLSDLRILGITSAARCPPSTPSPGNFRSCGCFVFTAISPWIKLPPSSSPPPAGAPVRPVAPSSIARATFTALNWPVVVLVVVDPVTSMRSPLQALRCSPRLTTFRSWTSP